MDLMSFIMLFSDELKNLHQTRHRWKRSMRTTIAIPSFDNESTDRRRQRTIGERKKKVAKFMQYHNGGFFFSPIEKKQLEKNHTFNYMGFRAHPNRLVNRCIWSDVSLNT